MAGCGRATTPAAPGNPSSTGSRRNRSARSRWRHRTPTSSMWAVAKGCVGRTCRSATASTARTTAGAPGRTLACALDSRPPNYLSTPRIAAAGVTWEPVLQRDADTGGSAVAIDPADPRIVYAGLWQSRLGPWEDKNEFEGSGGLYKSTDGGSNWRQLTAGLPANLSQINIAIAPSASR